MAKRSRTNAEIIELLNQAATGESIDKLSNVYDFTREQFDQWQRQFGNKFASGTRSRRPAFTEPFLSLAPLADELRLPFDSILYFASEGYIPIYASVHKSDVMYVSIHKDFIAPHGLDLPATVVALANPSMIGVSHLGDQNMVGFFLSQEDCRSFLREGKLRQSLFPAALRTHLGHYHPEFPLPGYFPIERHPDLDPRGWRAACYPKETSFVLDPERGYPPATELMFRLASLRVLQEDIEAFLDVIDSDAFLHDLVEPEIKTDSANGTQQVSHVIVEKPAYISAKLTHLIELSERFWRTKPSDGSNDYTTKREKVRKHLDDADFLDCFKMSKASKTLLETAARFIEPLYARSNISNEAKQSGHEYLAPELLILLAASKLFWSPPHVDLSNTATHPKKEDIEAYLRIRGVTGNDADYAVTLIRPEQADYGSPKPYISLWDKDNPLLRERHHR